MFRRNNPPQGEPEPQPEPDDFGQIHSDPETVKPGEEKPTNKQDDHLHLNELEPQNYYIEPELLNNTKDSRVDGGIWQDFNHHYQDHYPRHINTARHKFIYSEMLNELEHNIIREVPFAGMGIGSSKKEAEPTSEPKMQPDPYPSRAGWREPFVGEYVPVPEPDELAEFADLYNPKVKIGEYEVAESDVSFDDIGGNQKAKGVLLDIAEKFADPEVHTKWDDQVPKGVLLYGEPGTGKTLLAKAFAKEVNAAFIAVPVAQLRDKFYGETEKNLEQLFKDAGKHKGHVIIFFDEIDSLLVDRQGVPASHPDAQLVNVFLQAMDGMESAKNVMVLGATNNPWRLDEAATRPGRFDRKVEVELPDREGCSDILARQLLKAERKVGRPMVEDKLDLAKLGEYLYGLSGADIAEVVNRVKGTMAKTEKAMKKKFSVAMSDVEFDESAVAELLISTDDILPAIINYRFNG